MSTETTQSAPEVGCDDWLCAKEVSDEEWLKFLSSYGFTDEGWIDEAGNWWPVDTDMYWLHGDVAKWVLGENGEAEADRRGWVRISDYGSRCAKRPNKKQRDRLFDYAMHFGVEYHELLAAIEASCT